MFKYSAHNFREFKVPKQVICFVHLFGSVATDLDSSDSSFKSSTKVHA